MYSNKREKKLNGNNLTSNGLNYFRQQNSINVVVKPPHANGTHQVMELSNNNKNNQNSNLNLILQNNAQQEQNSLSSMEQETREREQFKANNHHNSKKLLSSKSLSKLVSKGFFFRTSKQQQQAKHETTQKLSTTKSLTNFKTINGGIILNCNENQNNDSGRPFRQTTSAPHLPRHSSRKSFEPQSGGASDSMVSMTFDKPFDVSPIVGVKTCSGQNNALVNSIVSPQTFNMECSNNKSNLQEERTSFDNNNNNGNKMEQVEGAENKDSNNNANNLKKKSKLKNTKLILRDVKNSISLRMKAKHESQAFSKLTNELGTPPTKLYSPFNIYLDSCSKDSKRKLRIDRSKADRDLSMEVVATSSSSGGGGHINNSMEMDFDDDNYYYDADNAGGDINNVGHFETPAKSRIALQHKKHLIQASKFTFFSPTGRLRKTVKEVEQFQQCIEDISKAIRARETVGQ